MVGYAIVAQIAGCLPGPFSQRLRDQLAHAWHDLWPDGSYTPQAAIIWAIYNFVVYALLLFAYFRWRGYSLEQLNLHSNNLRADIVLICIVFAVEATAELLTIGDSIFSLSGPLLVYGASLAFVLNPWEVLRIRSFIYCIFAAALPEIDQLDNSAWRTPAMRRLRLGDSWTNYGS